ncbi:NAD(P)-binding domain-containing protein [Lentzea flava]|uniref:Pyridine nucleotide-disulfide oxidoreductase n=1 Tax=Lentzea flava TaxID=103732 RepID=A0ABQ2UC44_9PSEU|nr:NAD(P)-binding domain-containing protein [Lentzea flava]MCP2197419.1 Pyridine nucleotide-disulfide oxidoreductase [Lentzea flava]GGU19571.1 pyridine nucleotide-disulfide oxidoreductase [Lentzea flava]
MVEYLVVGAGPAGLQMGRFLHQAGRDYVIVEAEPGPGSFFRRFPRHRVLATDDNSLFDGVPFARYSKRAFPGADDLVRYLEDFARPLNVRYNTRVTRLDQFDARHVILATGKKPYVPGIPGVEHAETYASASTDPTEYAGKRVLIIGRGHSAFETADHIATTARITHTVGRSVQRIVKRGNEFVATIDGTGQLRYDKVVVCTGFRRDTSLDVPHAHVLAGDSIKAIRHAARALHRTLEAEHHGVPWPHRKVRNRPDSLAATVAVRAREIPDGLADVVVPQGGHALLYDEMPTTERNGFVVTSTQICHYRKNELIAVERRLHRKPLERFFSQQLAVPCIS